MADNLKPSPAFVFSRNPIVDPKNGMPTYPFLKQLTIWATQLTNGLSQIGQITQPIPDTTPVGARTEGIGVTLQNIDDAGVVTAGGIDFDRAYLNKDTDHIADGTGSPLAGGKAAEIALVTSAPVPTPKKFLKGMLAGVFTEEQPDFSDLSGNATAAQVPALSALNGQIDISQLPSAGISVTITTAKLTVGGTDGSMSFSNGLLVGQVAAT